jgi:hypothetical protein
MHALSATPTRDLCPPRRRGLGAIARQVAVDLTPQAIEQIATRVATLVHRQQQRQQAEQPHEPTGMLTVTQLAQHLNLNRAWVYEHADELDAIRIGSGPKARIRFDFQTAKAALAQHRTNKTPAPALAEPKRSRRRPAPADAPLLPVYERPTLGVFGGCHPLQGRC